MTRTRLLLLALSTILLASGAAAEVWTVTLQNGTTFETRYRPEPAAWDPDVMIFVTTQGNEIGLPAADIADTISASEASGFGYRLDTTTLFLGWSPNDLVGENEEGEDEALYDAPALPQADYSVQQFINVPVVGQGGAPASGIPVFEAITSDGGN